MKRARTPSKSPRTQRWHRSIRWGSGIALLALMPKCLLCVAAYIGLGAVLGLGGPELCGASPRSGSAWTPLAIAVGVVVGTASVWGLHSFRRGSSATANSSQN